MGVDADEQKKKKKCEKVIRSFMDRDVLSKRRFWWHAPYRAYRVCCEAEAVGGMPPATTAFTAFYLHPRTFQLLAIDH